MNSNEQYAYLAGIVDGEGSIYITKSKNKQFTAGLKVAMNDKPALVLFQSVFGGKISKGTRKIDKRNNKLYAPAWVLQYRSLSDIKFIISKLAPFLQVKSKQAQIILDFIELKFFPGDKFQTQGRLNNKYIQCRAEKKRGWIK
jgi:LAGLIDADG endonuclease